MTDISDRLLNDIVDAVKDLVRKEQSDRLRDIYLIGDIDKDSARHTIERLRELANDSRKPITLYINSAGGNVTDGLALHDAIAHLVNSGITITIVVQGMAYSMGSVVLQAASPGRRWSFPALVDHDPRAGEVGRVAVHDRCGAAPRSLEADAGSDLPDPRRSLGQAAPPDHPRHQADRLVPGLGPLETLRSSSTRSSARRSGSRTASRSRFVRGVASTPPLPDPEDQAEAAQR